MYGKIGIKVWVFRGEIFGKPDLSPNANMGLQSTSADSRPGDRGPRGRDDDRRGGRRRPEGAPDAGGDRNKPSAGAANRGRGGKR